MLTGQNITDPRPDDTIKVMRRNGFFGDMSLATLIGQFPQNVVGNLYVGNTLTVGGAADLGPTTVTSMYNEGNESIVGTLNVTGNTTLGEVSGGAASFSSLVVTGVISSITQPLTDNSTAVATTAFVKGQNYASQAWITAQGYTTQGWVTSQNYATQSWVLGQNYISSAALLPYAPLASPAFSGTPTAPTPAVGDNSLKLATTAYVQGQGFAPINSPSFTGVPTAPTPNFGDSTTKIATTAFVAAAFSGGGSGYAPLASPAFTGNPTAPTPATADNSISIATTAYVQNQNYATQNWVSTQGYATQAWVTGRGYAPIASPTFTGTPAAPTPAAGDSSTALATTAFVKLQNYVTAAALTPYAPLASPTFTGLVTTNGFLGTTDNTAGFAPTSLSGIFFSWNHTQGQGEGDLWNTYVAGGNPSFNFYQMTGASAASLVGSLGLSSASFPGGIYAAGSASVITGIATNFIAGGSTAFNRGIVMATGSYARWAVLADTEAEGGSNAGSNFLIANYNDTGGYLGSPISITRATGIVNMPSGAITVTQPITDSSANIATTSFVWTRGMQSGGQISITAPAALTDAQAGHNCICGGSGTISLPSSVRTFMLSNVGAALITLSSATGSDFSTQLWPGQTVVLAGDGGGFYRVIADGNCGNSLQAEVPSWTPTMLFGGASVGVTYSQQVGYYQVEGRYMTCSWGLTLTSKGTSTGQASIGGFPAGASDGWGWVACGSLNLIGMSGPPLICVGTNGQAIIYMSNTGGIANVTDANIAANAIINGTVRYRI